MIFNGVFARQEEIEAAEEALVMKAQGLNADGEPLANAPTQQTFNDPAAAQQEARRQARVNEAKQQAAKYVGLSKEAKSRGTFEGFKRPKDKADRLRAGVPFKYKSVFFCCAI